MPFQPIIPTWLALNGSNDTSASGITDQRTGEPVHAGGLNIGDYFDLTEQEANTLSIAETGILHAGRYRRVQVHPGATAANIGMGKVALIVPSLIPETNIVTSADQGLVCSHVCIFLNTIDPGNYGFVQELGTATVLCSPTITVGTPTTACYISASLDGTVDGTGILHYYFAYFVELPSANAYARIVFLKPFLQG